MRSPDAEQPATCGGATAAKEGEGYVLHTNVEEVVLNATVLEGTQLVQTLKKDNFQVFEDGVKQNIISFQHTDLPVSIGFVVDNSGIDVEEASRGEQDQRWTWWRPRIPRMKRSS